MEFAGDLVRKLGYFFYLVWPSEHMFSKIEDVPDYAAEVIPCFVMLIVGEQAVLLLKGNSLPRLNESVGALILGLAMQLFRIWCRFAEIYIYAWVFNKYRLVDLPCDSYWIWWFAFLACDFCFYVQHRIGHEVNLFWAVHQIHHTTQDFNLISGFRMSFLMPIIDAVLIWPAAFILPPAMFFTHWQINLLYQYWLHTETVRSMGPLEYILNTPSHHRVHHGQNRYCIDKNFAGVLIIWDRMFGTFQWEKEPVVYGMLHPARSFEPFTVQFHHLLHIWKQFWEMKGWNNKMSILFKGPGWSPGKPRLGNIEDVPVHPENYEKYNPYLPPWCKVYVVLHVALLLLGYQELVEKHENMASMESLALVSFILLSSGAIGLILDQRKCVPRVELVRCVGYFVLEAFLHPSFYRLHPQNPFIVGVALSLVKFVYTTSLLLWGYALLVGDPTCK